MSGERTKRLARPRPKADSPGFVADTIGDVGPIVSSAHLAAGVLPGLSSRIRSLARGAPFIAGWYAACRRGCLIFHHSTSWYCWRAPPATAEKLMTWPRARYRGHPSLPAVKARGCRPGDLDQVRQEKLVAYRGRNGACDRYQIRERLWRGRSRQPACRTLLSVVAAGPCPGITSGGRAAASL
jgi:hypothetical protein